MGRNYNQPNRLTNKDIKSAISIGIHTRECYECTGYIRGASCYYLPERNHPAGCYLCNNCYASAKDYYEWHEEMAEMYGDES